ncbi:MAG: DUF4344 domain-containing metallopeptidase [Kofleriaceae bacterium]
MLIAFVASCMPFPGQNGYGQSGYDQNGYGQTPGYGAAPGSGPEGEIEETGANARMNVVFEPPKKREREAVRDFLQQTQLFQQVTGVFNRMFRFPQPLTVVWSECGVVNASWDGKGHIVMCYELAEFLKTLFINRVKDRKQLRIAAMSSLYFVFLHEFGHALISMYKLPAVGREEDAADQLAALVLINSGDDGVGIAMLGAGFFRVLASSGSKTPFFDEHSLDEQRFYNVMCLVYGSNPQRFASLVSDKLLPKSRAARCPAEYTKVHSAWNNLLAGHSRPNWQQQPRQQQPRSAPPRSYSDDDEDYGDDPRSGDQSPQPRAGNSGSGEWSCRAVASYAPPSSSGGPDYSDTQNVDITKWGRTREAAGSAALDACSGMLSLSANATIYPGSLVLDYCKVLSCSR